MQNFFRNVKHVFINNKKFLGIVWDVSKFQFVLRVAISTVSALFPAVNILIIKYLIELMERSEKENINVLSIFLLVAGYIFVQLIPQIINIWNNFLNNPRFMWKVKKSINNKLIQKASELDYLCFDNTEFYNKYTQALSQIDNTAYNVFSSFFSLLSASITMISIIALLVTTDIVVLIFAVFGVGINFIRSLMEAHTNNELDQKFIPFTRFHNYLRSILFSSEYAHEVRCNPLINLCSTKYNETTEQILSLTNQSGRKMSIRSIIFTLLHALCEGGMYAVILFKVINGQYTIATFSLLTNSASQIESSIGAFMGTLSVFYSNSLKIDNVSYILDYKPQHKNKEGKKISPQETCSIEFDHVSFRYPNSSIYVLQDISFLIHPGEKVAIVGLNGSGKTTLIKLLLKLYLPERGTIRINGVPIQDLQDDEYQYHIGVVFQNFKLFAFSIKENISFDKELGEVIDEYQKIMGVDEILKRCPQGWDTILSKEFNTDGTVLSGGESQKIAFLRALNKNAFLYVLDEPSAALDPKSEYDINQLTYSIQNKTTIITTHRLSATVMADRILFLEKGRLIENGSHRELIEYNGKYAELFHLQANKYI